MGGVAEYLVYDVETVPTELGWDPASAAPGKNGEPAVAPVPHHRIVTIGMMPLDGNLLPVAPAQIAGARAVPRTEAAMLTAWSAAVRGRERAPLALVDFNGRGFDMPVLQTRAFRHGIAMPWYFGRLPDNRGERSQWSKEYRDRYGGQHLDLRDWWTNRGGFAATKLEHLTKLMGLPGKLGFDGSQVHDAWKAGEQARIDAYCLSDVYATALVFARMWLLAGKLTRDGYRTACMAILDCAAGDPTQAELCASVDRERVLALEVP